MKPYRVETHIKAPRDRVWAVLTQEMPRDPTPFGILKIDGHIAPGSRLKLWSEVAPNRAFTLKIIAFDTPARMVWQGGMPLGLFTGTRRFTLTSTANGTQFAMDEAFRGALSSMIVKSMPDLTPSFEKFAQALKERAETHV